MSRGLPSSPGLLPASDPGIVFSTMAYTPQPTSSRSQRSRWVRLGCLGIAVVLLWVLSFPALMVFRMWSASERVDQSGGVPPPWLPKQVTELHIRGTKLSTYFSGKASLDELEAWAASLDLPIKQRRNGQATMIDYGKVPLNWTKFNWHDPALQTTVENVEEIVWERRAANGGGITLHYIPSLRAFHGNRALW